MKGTSLRTSLTVSPLEIQSWVVNTRTNQQPEAKHSGVAKGQPLDNGHWTIDIGYGTMDIGYWTMYIGHWTKDNGHWTMDIGQ